MNSGPAPQTVVPRSSLGYAASSKPGRAKQALLKEEKEEKEESMSTLFLGVLGGQR